MLCCASKDLLDLKITEQNSVTPVLENFNRLIRTSQPGSLHCTGKYLLKALILASSNPQYD